VVIVVPDSEVTVSPNVLLTVKLLNTLPRSMAAEGVAATDVALVPLALKVTNAACAPALNANEPSVPTANLANLPVQLLLIGKLPSVAHRCPGRYPYARESKGSTIHTKFGSLLTYYSGRSGKLKEAESPARRACSLWQLGGAMRCLILSSFDF